MRRLGFWLALAASAAILYGAHVLDSDEGLSLNAAWQLWHGKRLYVDFIEYVPPGTPWAILAAWKLAGTPSYLAAKLLALGAWLGSAVAVHGAARRIAGSIHAADLAVLFWLGCGTSYSLVNHNSLSSCAATGALAAALAALERGERRYPFLAGLAGGLTLLFLHTKGALLLVACGVSLAVFARGDARARLGGFLGGAALPLLSLPLCASPSTLLDALAVFPARTGYLAHSSFSPAILAAEAAIVLVLALWAALRRSAPLALLALVQAALYASALNLVDLEHAGINSFPLAIAVAAGLAAVVEPLALRGWTPARLAGAIAAGLVVFLFTPPGRAAFADSVWAIDVLGHEQPGLLESPEIRRAEHIYAGPFLPGFYYELRKPNPFRVSNMLLCDPACQREVLETLQATRPEYAFLHYPMAQRFGYVPGDVDRWLLEHYARCPNEQFPGLLILARDRCP